MNKNTTTISFRCPQDTLEAIDAIGQLHYPNDRNSRTNSGCDRSKTLFYIIQSGIAALTGNEVQLPQPRHKPWGTNTKVVDFNKSTTNRDLSTEFIRNSSVVVDFDFPKASGIYLVRMLNNNEWVNLYLGISKNLQERWVNHHRQNEINFLISCGIEIQIKVLVESEIMQFTEPLDIWERKLIHHLKPKWNDNFIHDLPQIKEA